MKEDKKIVTRSVSLTPELNKWVDENIPNFSAWLREKLQEEIRLRREEKSIFRKLATFLKSDLCLERDEEGKLWIVLRSRDGDSVQLKEVEIDEYT